MRPKMPQFGFYRFLQVPYPEYGWMYVPERGVTLMVCIEAINLEQANEGALHLGMYDLQKVQWSVAEKPFQVPQEECTMPAWMLDQADVIGVPENMRASIVYDDGDGPGAGGFEWFTPNVDEGKKI